MTDFIKFPKIRQFRDIIKHVKSRADFKGLDDGGNAIFEHKEAYPTMQFEGTIKMHGCVSANTLIRLANGETEEIQSISEGTAVMVYDEKNKCQSSDIVEKVIVQNLNKEWYKLEFDDGTVLECTSDHPILTDIGWIPAKDLMDENIMFYK